MSQFRGPGFDFGAFGTLLYLAERGLLGIRTGAGLWCQTYERGWPRTPPFLVEQHDSFVGLLVVAALSQRWCPGLPYTPETVDAAIPEPARRHVTVEWRSEDDVVPQCPAEPRCVLSPTNIGRWL